MKFFFSGFFPIAKIGKFTAMIILHFAGVLLKVLVHTIGVTNSQSYMTLSFLPFLLEFCVCVYAFCQKIDLQLIDFKCILNKEENNWKGFVSLELKLNL